MKDKDIVSSHLRALACGAGLPPERLKACPDDETFGAFVDGALDETAASRIRAHLAECPACSTAYQAMKETADATIAVPPELLQAAKNLVAARPAGAAAETAQSALESIKKAGADAAAAAERIVLELLAGALRVLDIAGLHVTAGLEPSFGPVRSASTEARADAPILEVASTIAQIERISLQKIDPDDVRIMIRPARTAVERSGKLFRVDLLRGERLMQSWPLGPEMLAMEPITYGRYVLQVIELKAVRPARPAVIGTIDIQLQA